MRAVVLFYLCHLTFAILGQELNKPDVSWETLVGMDGQEELKKIISLNDGKAISIGTTNSKPGKKIDQYFTVVSETGKLLNEKIYGSKEDDNALGLTHTFDGAWVYCGYVQEGDYNKSVVTYRQVPNIRKVDQNGKALWSHIEKSINGYFNEIVEIGPEQYVLSGNESGKSILAFYHQKKLIRKHILKDNDMEIRDIYFTSDQKILMVGESKTDHYLWYSMIDLDGKQIWNKKGPNGYRAGKSIIKLPDGNFAIGGEYYDTQKRIDAYIIKINPIDGNILSKSFYGGKYEDNFGDLVTDNEGQIYLVGNTNSHIRGGARRTKAWMIKINSNTLKQEEEYIWGGNQNNHISAAARSSTGNLLLAGWTSSGEADGKDGWIMQIPIKTTNMPETKPINGPLVKLSEIALLESIKNDTININEGVSFLASLSENSTLVPNPKATLYVNNILNTKISVSSESIALKKINIPLSRQLTYEGLQVVKIVFSINDKRLDSISKSFYFETPAKPALGITIATAVLRDKLEAGMAIIDIPIKFQNTGNTTLDTLSVSTRGLEDASHSFDKDTIDLKVNETKLQMLTLKMNDYGAEDTLSFEIRASNPGGTFIQKTKIPIKQILVPLYTARKSQTDVLIAQKIKSGTISPINEDEYNKLPLDSFFMRQQKYTPAITNVISKNVDLEKIIIIWLDPDQVVNKNYLKAKRDRFTVRIKLISQLENMPPFKIGFTIERPDKKTIDTIPILLDQGVLLGSYQYNIQSDIELHNGENKVKLVLWNDDEIVKTSATMIIHYTPPRNNLFVYAYGVADPSLENVTKDAQDLAKSFESQQSKLYNTISAKVFNTKENTSTQAIRKSIRDIVLDYSEYKRIKKDDVLLLYFSSHGLVLDNEFYLVPSDFDPLYEEETTINMVRDIQSRLKDLPCKKLLFIDACHSGAAISSGTSKDIARNSGIKQIDPFERELSNVLVRLSESSNDFYYLLSSSSGEVSYTDATWSNSAFTKAILEAFTNKPHNTLKGVHAADEDNNQILDLKELYFFIRDRVPVIIQSKKKLTTGQTPYTPDAEVLKNIPIYVWDR